MTQLLEDQRKACDIVTAVLLELKTLTQDGVSLDMLDELAERMIRERGGIPCNKGYHPRWAETPYPSTICASIDFEACHTPPGKRILQEGQIVKYDLGVKYGTGCGDACITVAVGEISNRKARAMRYGLRALQAGISVVKAGVPISAIGQAIRSFCLTHGYEVVKEYGGHYIGTEMHQEPLIPHYYDEKYDNIFLKEGDVICLEPLVTPGDGKVSVWQDGWTVYCPDRQVVVCFEHQMIVTKDGCEVLTKHL